eukprot:COSAG02_NODE_12109_length_1594_cov_4.008027_2_plen_327_part_00
MRVPAPTRAKLALRRSECASSVSAPRMAPEASAVEGVSLGEWASLGSWREHKTALVAAALFALTPLLYSAAVRRRRSQRRAQALDIQLSAAERSAAHSLYRSVLQGAAEQRRRAPTQPTDGPPAIDWARVLRSGMNTIGDQDGYDPVETLGLDVGADGQPVELENFEMFFKQMKVDGVDELTVLAICRHAMLSEQAHHTAQIAAMNRKAAERRRSDQNKATTQATGSSRAAQAAITKAGEVPERLRALFPSLRGGGTSVPATPLEAAELRRVVTQARQALAGEVSLSAVKGEGHVEAVEEEGVDTLRRAKPTDGSLLSSVDSPSTT